MAARVAILMVPHVVNVEIRQFWTGKWTEIPSPSFSIAQVPPVIKMKAQWTKNKDLKPHGAKGYLTLNRKREILKKDTELCGCVYIYI